MIREEDSFDELFRGTDPDLKRFSMTVRTFNILKREGVETVGDFMAKTPGYIYGLRNAGFKVADEVSALQQEIRRQRARQPSFPKDDSESQTAYTVRLIQWQAWWQGHDAVCEKTFSCTKHLNPFDEAD
jgi:hypothetical protein